MGSFNSYGSQVPDTFATNDILFYTLATEGNTADFGNILANGENSSRQGGSNSIRGLCMGSFNSYGSQVPDTFATNDILFYTLATEGNTADFGDLTYACYGSGTSTGSSTRMVHAGNDRDWET